MKKKRPVAVFDIDGTIFRASLFLELVERLIEKGIFPPETRNAYEEEYEKWLNRKGDYEAYVEKVIEVFLSHIKGVSYTAMEDATNEIIEEKKDRVYRYTRDLVKKLKKEGYFLLAISHSPRFIVDAFGFELGFDKIYGFFYETGPSGAFTGKVEDVEVIRNKAAVLQRAVRKENLTLEHSIGVGDTESDIPMLEMVEKAIAFNPNQKLYTHAKKRMWKVVVERKDVIYEL
ncbi:MAG: HAD family phosphatase [Patescibacteria group bacterium]